MYQNQLNNDSIENIEKLDNSSLEEDMKLEESNESFANTEVKKDETESLLGKSEVFGQRIKQENNLFMNKIELEMKRTKKSI